MDTFLLCSIQMALEPMASSTSSAGGIMAQPPQAEFATINTGVTDLLSLNAQVTYQLLLQADPSDRLVQCDSGAAALGTAPWNGRLLTLDDSERPEPGDTTISSNTSNCIANDPATPLCTHSLPCEPPVAEPGSHQRTRCATPRWHSERLAAVR